MEELCDTLFTPLFGESGVASYYVTGYGCSVISKTRNRSCVMHSSSAADGLYADNLWPGCYVLADLLVHNPWLCKAGHVLELGAGSALPSLVAAVLEARTVIITDYPEPTIIGNIDVLIKLNGLDNAHSSALRWGETVDHILETIHSSPHSTGKFNVILCAELLWRDTYSQHDNLLRSISQCLCRESGIAVATFVHRPTAEHKPEHDLEFFSAAEARYGMHSKHLGVVNKYKDCLDDSEENAEVQVYLLYYSADIANVSLH
jgi:predicted nicotinamide N-methyase